MLNTRWLAINLVIKNKVPLLIASSRSKVGDERWVCERWMSKSNWSVIKLIVIVQFSVKDACACIFWNLTNILSNELTLIKKIKSWDFFTIEFVDVMKLVKVEFFCLDIVSIFKFNDLKKKKKLLVLWLIIIVNNYPWLGVVIISTSNNVWSFNSLIKYMLFIMTFTHKCKSFQWNEYENQANKFMFKL